MDVLRPPVVWIKGRCYRKLPFEQNSSETNENSTPYYEQDEMNYEDETCDASDVVEETKSGFRTVMDTPSALFKFVIGRKAETKKKIEMETDTRLFIPSQGQAGDIGICWLIYLKGRVVCTVMQ
ncbi:activating signal cointegrator 1 complex subunit 1-like [Actinia tenebrosa]|uniref:Activating signal cointegrator 1 complex subunit 1-like n=1 Tax=Actinia tenebrosa TaxID=6105 RepID=A0A6P8IUA2_ACTTE|nr:activating signal cointegrator 1 complex subunit 1-like [Actinia tenebrosa]